MSARIDHAERALAAAFSGDHAPLGVAVGVVDGTGRALACGGSANIAGAAVTADTAFDVASVTKVAATTTALLRLATLGRVTFDDPVSRYLPHTRCAPQTTLRDLLHHRAGLWEWQPLYLESGDPIERIAALPPRYDLHAGRHYSDLGFMLLGRIVEIVVGADLAVAVRDLVTEPLGMNRTGYAPVAAPVASSAVGDAVERAMVDSGEPYPILTDRRDFAWRDGEVTGAANDGNCAHAFGGIAGHAGLFSTVDDLLTLGRALAGPAEHDDLWHGDLVADMFRDGPDDGQALGWRSTAVRIGGGEERMLWHPGFTGCALGVVPASGTAIVLLSNRLLAPAPETTQSIWQRVHPALLGADAPRTIEGMSTS